MSTGCPSHTHAERYRMKKMVVMVVMMMMVMPKPLVESLASRC